MLMWFKNLANAAPDFVIPRVSLRSLLSMELHSTVLQCLKRPIRMTRKIVSFCQDSDSVNNNHCRGKKKSNTILNGFSDYYITNVCLVSAIFRECLVFVNNKLFSDRNWLLYGKCNFFNRTFFYRNHVKLLLVIIKQFFILLTFSTLNTFANIYFTELCLKDQCY